MMDGDMAYSCLTLEDMQAYVKGRHKITPCCSANIDVYQEVEN